MHNIDTKKIRRDLIRITRKYSDKRMDKLSEDIMDLCDAYDDAIKLESVIKAGQDSLDQSFNMLTKLQRELR